MIPDQWDICFSRLVEFKAKHGHCRVPIRYPDHELAYWVTNQRIDYEGGALNSDRIEKLDSLGFTWALPDESWDEMFTELQKHYAKNGHFLVPHVSKYQRLATWVMVQRKKHRHGTLQKNYIERLESLGFEWKKSAKSTVWDKMFARLQKFHAEHGHCLVPSPSSKRVKTLEDKQFGHWVISQRTRYRKGTLRKSRISKLDSLGFTWLIVDDSWEEMIEELRAFVAKHGHANVKRGLEHASYKKLAIWVSTQRQNKKKGRYLDSDRVRRLEELGFLWKPLRTREQSKSDEFITQLEKFFHLNGHFAIPNAPPNVKLYKAIQKRLPTLDQDQPLKRDLEKLGFPLDEKACAWERMFSIIKYFHDRRGHFRLPDGSAMQLWAKTQRELAACGNLEPDQEDRLEELGLLSASFPGVD